MQNTECSCMQMIQHITHCLCSSNSPSMVLYCFQTHRSVMMLHHATCTPSHGWRTGRRAFTSRIQPKFKWFKKLHCRRAFVVASRNKSCNSMNMDRSVFVLQGKIFKANVFTCLKMPPHLRHGSCLLTFWSYHMLPIQVSSSLEQEGTNLI